MSCTCTEFWLIMSLSASLQVSSDRVYNIRFVISNTSRFTFIIWCCFISLFFWCCRAFFLEDRKQIPQKSCLKKASVFVNCCFSGCTSASHSFNNGLFSVLIQTLLLKHTIARPKDFQKLFGFDLKLFYFRSQEDFVDCSEGTSAPPESTSGKAVL